MPKSHNMASISGLEDPTATNRCLKFQKKWKMFLIMKW